MIKTAYPARLGSRSRPPSVAGAVLVIALALAAAGCSITLKAEHVPSGDLANAVQRIPGIYYALPLTELNVIVPARVELESAGPWAGFDGCIANCKRPGATTCKQADVKPKEAAARVTLLSATVNAAAVPDSDHVYRVVPQTSNPFMTVNHEFTLAGGRVRSAKTSASDQTATVIASSIGSALGLRDLLSNRPQEALDKSMGLLMSRKPDPSARGRSESAPDAHACAAPGLQSLWSHKEFQPYDYLTGIDLNEKKAGHLAKLFVKEDALSCEQVRCFAATIYDMREMADQTQKRAEAYLNSAEAPNAPLAALRLEQARLKSADWLSRAAALRKKGGMAIENSTATVTISPRTGLRPKLENDGTSSSKFEYSREDWRIDGPADLSPVERQPYADAATTWLAKNALTTTVQLEDASKPQAQKEWAPSVEGGGYRYRLPASGRVQIELTLAAEAGSKRIVLLDETLPIAQFGKLASLPSQFAGTKASLNFTLADDGTLASVAMGQESQSAAPLNTLVADLKKRETEREGAALKAAKAETDQTAEAIKSEKHKRCLAALKTEPATVPDFCK